MNDVFANILDVYVVIYLDGIMIYSSDPEIKVISNLQSAIRVS